MSDELLPFYNRELAYVRKLAADFAQANPKIAGRLRINTDTSEDPHVERLIEAFAYLNARTRRKLEDDFPELSEALLGVLYPRYLAPLPSMAIAQFDLETGQVELTAGYTVPRHQLLETEPIDGEPCRFRTCYPTTAYPIDVRAAVLSQPPFDAPVTPGSTVAAGMLKLTLTCRSEAVRFADLQMPFLRFFLKGPPQTTYLLYELLFNHVLDIALANKPSDREFMVVGPEYVGSVGFAADEAMLPASAREFRGYGLLTDFFAFPEKYLFFDLLGLDLGLLAGIGNQLEVYVYLDRAAPDLQRNLTAENLQLGCCPIINLFPHRADPITLTQRDWEFRIIPDARRPLALEIHTIERVTATSQHGDEAEFRPFYSVKHTAQAESQMRYWHHSRRTAAQRPNSPPDHGTEMFLSLIDLNFQPAPAPDLVLDVETLCLNRDLPHRLPFGGDQPRMRLSEGSDAVALVRCLTAPTRTHRPASRHGVLWKLISHLSLNHLSLSDNEFGAEALREILKLYDHADSEESRSVIDGVLRISTRRIVSRPRNEIGGAFSRGLEVVIHFDEKKFTGSGLYLFAAVLERFLPLYCTLNSFTKLIATVEGRKKELRRWLPRMGERPLA